MGTVDDSEAWAGLGVACAIASGCGCLGLICGGVLTAIVAFLMK